MRLRILALLLSATPIEAQGPLVLQPSDPEPWLEFGDAVALDGERLLVAAPGVGSVTGRAYVFRSTQSGWVEEAKLEAPGALGFGSSVALAGFRAFVGAEGHVNDEGAASGAVFVFERNGTSWGLSTVLLPSDADAASGFGHDVAAEPGRVLVASAARAYLFEHSGGAWNETATFAGEAERLDDVDLFGDLVALAHSSVFVFERQAAGWDSGTLLPSPNQIFPAAIEGQRVALEEGRVSAVSLAGPCLFGQVNAYDRVTGEWRLHSISHEASAGTRTAHMDGDRLVVSRGSLLSLFRALPSGGMIEQGRFWSGAQMPFGLAGDGGISGNLVVLGAPQHDASGSGSGAVFVWEVPALSALPQAMAASSGGVQELVLRRGVHETLSLFWIFGSASGTEPGLIVDGLAFPLNFDDYSSFLAVNPNAVVLPTIATLGRQGEASARIELPPLDPSLVGVTLHHAFLTFDFGSGPVVDFASNAVALRFTTEVALEPQDFEGAALGWNFGSGESMWQTVEDGECGAVSRMAAYTTPAPICGADLGAVSNARLVSAPFLLGEVGDWELSFDSILTPGLSARVRMRLEGDEEAYFELAWPGDFIGNGTLESLSFHVPGIEHAIGIPATFEFVLSGVPMSGAPAGWWVDEVELVKLP